MCIPQSGYYMPQAIVIRENYRPVPVPLSSLEPLGDRLQTKCAKFNTFWLEKFQTGGKFVSFKFHYQLYKQKKAYFIFLKGVIVVSV
jgi:hypothetical protein